MSILYNTTSKLISKYQKNLPSKNVRLNSDSRQFSNSSNDKNTLNITDHGIINIPDEIIDIPFKSKYPKNSKQYLTELCKSVYPKELHPTINSLDSDVDLAIHAFMSLIVKNYVTYWYGRKIPTEDNEFIIKIFNLIQDIITRGSKNFDGNLNITHKYEALLFDDIPYIISEHFNSMKKCKIAIQSQNRNSKSILEMYSQLTCYNSKDYPGKITILIKPILMNDSCSTLQSTFFDSLLDDFLMGRIWCSISHPYYLIKGINKICYKINSKKKTSKQEEYAKKNNNKYEDNNLAIIISQVYLKFLQITQFFWFLICLFKSNDSQSSNDILKKPKNESSIVHRYIFNFILIDTLKLNNKKPLIFFVLQIIRKLIIHFKQINNNLQTHINMLIYSKLCSKRTVYNSIDMIRTLMFPNDNSMGPRTIIPEGKDWEIFKTECASDIWDIILNYKLNIFLNIKKDEITEFIELLTIEPECNAILYYRLLDCILAYQCDQENDTVNYL
ncbi:hypothetical protein TBLA_0H03140 [Henningerozyma blattae CBS 6284]|uniref:PXA domain-containing protein n=1 Tax=Henningerozyma blattae (strain ATCC 34711 / CBS 6284 / DSM 70876 / NBRC 10599 / NRRL Y-10934 / UCD 77-7) TaxID=1071380 RepID=I2H893_HENB6|nr:hypothetical protein TBLA_0H03140 [Tetrapisispora blattae CBS 6284]CCH62595.1 hypothetical protein TBLA_0H03140 [Tetrapisispora blattae CBS 6284]